MLCCTQSLCCVQLFVTPWTVTHQPPLSMEFSRKEYWSELPYLPSGDLCNAGIKGRSPVLQVDSLPSEPPGKPKNTSWKPSLSLGGFPNQGMELGSPSLVGRFFTSWGARETQRSQIRSDQISRSVMSDSLRPHESQHTRPPCPSPTPGVHSDSHPSSQWCHPAISSSVVPFSSCPQPPPASESFPMSQLFAWGGQSTRVSALASFLPKKSQGWSPSEWTGWISLQSRGLSRVFSNTRYPIFLGILC